MLAVLRHLLENNEEIQFLIATHSPILLAYRMHRSCLLTTARFMKRRTVRRVLIKLWPGSSPDRKFTCVKSLSNVRIVRRTNLLFMELAEYTGLIFAGLRTAVHAPYVPVSLGDWQPLIADCHNNVVRWVRGTLVIRLYEEGECGNGWRNGFFLTHHSVVRGKDGRLFDITPIESETTIRTTMRFIPHVGSDGEFFYFKTAFNRF